MSGINVLKWIVCDEMNCWNLQSGMNCSVWEMSGIKWVGLNIWDELFRMISLVENICYEMSEMNLQNELSLIKYLRMNCLRLSASDTVSEMQCQGWIYRTNCFGWIAVNKMFRNECFGMNYLGKISRIHYFEWIVRDVISRINLKKELQIKADKISGKKCLVMNYCLAWNIWDKMYQTDCVV